MNTAYHSHSKLPSYLHHLTNRIFHISFFCSSDPTFTCEPDTFFVGACDLGRVKRALPTRAQSTSILCDRCLSADTSIVAKYVAIGVLGLLFMTKLLNTFLLCLAYLMLFAYCYYCLCDIYHVGRI